MRMRKSIVLVASALVLATLYAGQAAASIGVVSGRLMFYNNQGNYCASDGRSCSGARYPASQFNVNMPIRDVKVYVRNNTDQIIGQGITDSNGNFKVSWWSPGSGNIVGNVTWHGEQKDGRFAIRTSSGGTWVFWTYKKTLRNNATTNFGTQVWGSNKGPNSLANLYDGAIRMWRDALNYSNRMRTYFTNVQIRAYSSSCPTSCANGEDKRIIIDSSTSAYRPQARVMHEMGHIASYLSHRDQERRVFVDYSRDGVAGWNMRSAEYAGPSFEEALATFYGDVALYWHWNPEPYSCLSSGPCPRIANNNVETSTGMRSSCSAGEERWALTSVRYLRDVYDSTSGESFDDDSEPYYQFFDAVNRFSNGYGNRSKDEPWDGFLWWTWVDDKDGRSARDFRAHLDTLAGISTYGEFSRNCYPAGD